MEFTLDALMTAISGLLSKVMIWSYNVLISAIQALIDTLAAAAIAVIGLFPAEPTMPMAPTLTASTTWRTFLNTLNWFFPIGYVADMVVFIIAGLVAYIVIAPVARWFKLLT